MVQMDQLKALNGRDALSMLLYSRLFDWLVLRVRRLLFFFFLYVVLRCSLEQINANIRSQRPVTSFISILDIYGFECFDNNSFEQVTHLSFSLSLYGILVVNI